MVNTSTGVLEYGTATCASVHVQVFNGGSDFNEPVKRCLDRLHTAAWANSDILLVSDGELRQPGSEIMRKLSGGGSLSTKSFSISVLRLPASLLLLESVDRRACRSRCRALQSPVKAPVVLLQLQHDMVTCMPYGLAVMLWL